MNVVNSAVVCVCTGMCVRLETKHRRPGKVAVLADPQQGPPHLYAGSLDHPFGQAYTPRSQHYDSGAVLEPPHFFAALQDRVAGDHIGASLAQVQKYIEESKADAGDQDGRHRHQRQHRAGGDPTADHRTLVLAEQPRDALQRDRIDVPGVAGNVVDLLDPAIGRRMESVVHARGQTQGRVLPTLVRSRQFRIRRKLGQRVGKALCLQHRPAHYRPAGADQTVAGTDEIGGARVDRASAVFQFPREALLQAFEVGGFCLAQVQVGEQAPHGDAGTANPGIFNAAPPAHETRHQTPRDAIAEQEVDVLLLCQPADQGLSVHLSVIGLQYSPPLKVPTRNRPLPRSSMSWPGSHWHSCCAKDSYGCSFLWRNTVRSRAMRACRGALPRGCRSTNMTNRASLASIPRRRRSSRRGAADSCAWPRCSKRASKKPSSKPRRSQAASPIWNSRRATGFRSNSAAMYAGT